MIVKVDQLGQEMTLIYESSIEEQQTNVSFTRSIQNAKFRKSKFSKWDGQVKFVKYGNRMAFGLWLELKRMCDRFGYPIKFEGLGNVIEEGIFTREYITEFCKNLLQEYEFDADEEQIESVYKALKYKKCFIDGCTSFGKTLISYIIYTLLRKQGKSRKTLMITIDAGLVIQANQDFLDYCGGRFDMKLTMIHGRSKYRDIKDSRMVIGNFQTLVNLPAEFYESFDAVLIDECVSSETIVNTRNGSKTIEDVQIGEYVLSMDENQNIIYDEIVDKWEVGTKETYRILCEDNHFIDCTINHKIFTNFGWLTLEEILLINNMNTIECYINDNHEQTPRTIDIWKFIRRWKHALSSQREQFSEIQSKTIDKTKSICNKKIRYTERFNQFTTEGNNKWWIWKISLWFYHKMFTRIYSCDGLMLSEWYQNCVNRMVKSYNRRRIGLLVYGRWWSMCNTIENINTWFFIRRTHYYSEVYDGKMEYHSRYHTNKEEIFLLNNECRESQQIPEIDCSIYYTGNDVQNLCFRKDCFLQDMSEGFYNLFNFVNLFKDMCRYTEKNTQGFIVKSIYSQLYNLQLYISNTSKKSKDMFKDMFRRINEKVKLCTIYKTRSCVKTKRIISIEKRKEEIVYDITTKDTHAFFGNNILVHNCHRGDTKSMKIIMEHCKNAKYKIGLSGSIKDDKHAEFYDLLSMYGPIVHRVTKRQWIDKGMAANIKINIVVLNYAPREIREELYNLKFNSSMEPDKIFVQEQRKVRESQKRLDWVSEFVGRLNGNVLVFFLDKMYGYGKNLTTSIRKKNDFKDVFYIDGDVDQDLREQYKEKMELGNNKVLVASYPTYSTGKSIKNIRHIVLAESRKSFEEISQMLGRGMRLTADKEECIVWDLVDDYSLTTREHKYIGYMNKHMNSRITTYTDEQLEFTKKEIAF
jgi:superfamily II DNA or RNA helicase